MNENDAPIEFRNKAFPRWSPMASPAFDCWDTGGDYRVAPSYLKELDERKFVKEAFNNGCTILARERYRSSDWVRCIPTWDWKAYEYKVELPTFEEENRRRAVEQEYKAGAVIEYRPYISARWFVCSEDDPPVWRWNTSEYRVSKKHTRRKSIEDAYKKGAKIEFCFLNGPQRGQWEYIRNPNWVWTVCNYRIAPKSKYRPWTAIEALGQKVRWKGGWNGYVIHRVDGNKAYMMHNETEINYSFKELLECFLVASTNEPCGVLE